jgi:hypothetical protein
MATPGKPPESSGQRHRRGGGVVYSADPLFHARVSERKAYAAQQSLEISIGSQGVHPGIHPGPNQSIRPFALRLFQPLQSSIRIA